MTEHIESDVHGHWPRRNRVMSIPTVELGVGPPPFGWVGNVKKLTGGEIGVIRKHVGTGMEENPLVWMMYAAVAFGTPARPREVPVEPRRAAHPRRRQDVQEELGIEEEPRPYLTARVRLAYAWRIAPAALNDCTLEEMDAMAELLIDIHRQEVNSMAGRPANLRINVTSDSENRQSGTSAILNPRPPKACPASRTPGGVSRGRRRRGRRWRGAHRRY